MRAVHHHHAQNHTEISTIDRRFIDAYDPLWMM